MVFFCFHCLEPRATAHPDETMLRKLLRLNSHCSYFLDYEYSILCEVQNQADPASAHSFCSTALVSHRDYEIWSFPSFQNSTNWIAIALKNLPTIKLILDVLCPNPWAIWRVGELVNQSANHSRPKCWIFFVSWAPWFAESQIIHIGNKTDFL